MNKNPLDIALTGVSRKTRSRRIAERLGKAHAMETIQYQGNMGSGDTNRTFSPNVWRDCPLNGLIDGSVDGVHFFDDFVEFGLPADQTTQVAQGRYKIFCSKTSAGSWKTDSMPTSTTVGTPGGIVSGGTDLETAGAGSMAVPSVAFSLSTALSTKLWFEARIALSTILTNAGQVFVGLGETEKATLSATVPLGDANATSNAVAMIGFNRLEDGLAVLNTSYADHATSWTNIQAAANAAPLTQLVASTWIKLGMRFDPSNSDRCVTFYVNGIECATAMTKAALLALTYLDSAILNPLIAFYNDSEGDTLITYIDWWRCAQQFI